jgi:hypothetical protein
MSSVDERLAVTDLWIGDDARAGGKATGILLVLAVTPAYARRRGPLST